MIFLNYFYSNDCIFIDLVFLLSCVLSWWASGSDDRGNPNPRIDVNKLIDWLIDDHIFFKSALIFGGLICNCLNYNYHCDDHILILKNEVLAVHM